MENLLVSYFTEKPNNTKSQVRLDHYEKQSNNYFELEYQKLKVFNTPDDFLNFTMKKFPYSSSLVNDSELPIGVTLNPFSKTGEEIPTIVVDPKNIMRCESCKGYINPFITTNDNMQTWTCNLCKKVNKTPDYYINNSEVNKREELKYGSYEIICKNYHFVRKCMNPCFIFILDVSFSSQKNNFLNCVLDSIKSIINSDIIPYPERTTLSLITYDDNIQFYNFSSSRIECYSIEVEKEDSEIYLPIHPDKFICYLEKTKNNFLSLLELIPKIYCQNNQKSKDSNKMFAAISAAKLLRNRKGAKLLVFNSSNSVIKTDLVQKSSVNTNNLESKEKIFLVPTDEGQISKIGMDLVEENITIDLFISSEQFCNLITLNQIVETTSGTLYFYKNFIPETDYLSLSNDINYSISGFKAWESLIKTRFSRLIHIDQLVCTNTLNEEGYISLACLDSDRFFPMKLRFNRSSKLISLDDNFFYIQPSITYTHSDGTRRIRVFNKCLQLTYKFNDMFQSVKIEDLSIFIFKLTIMRIFYFKNISDILMNLENMYRSIVSYSLTGMFLKDLPESLTYFPLYILGIIKNRAMCADGSTYRYDIDFDNYFRKFLLRLSPKDMINFIYPRIYPLKDLLTNSELSNDDYYIPEMINTKKSSFEREEAYLIDSGRNFILYIKDKTEKKILLDLFGTVDLNRIILINESTIFQNTNVIKTRLYNLVQFLRKTSFYQELKVCVEGSNNEKEINDLLIEDNYCKWFRKDYESFYINSVEKNTK